MPAPLARGLIFSISLLIAAGIAVYENPQVREWLDENRRKIALQLHNLGDEIHPRPNLFARSSDDASRREDESPAASERRRQARQELYERARILEEKKRAKATEAGRGGSFDDLVDSQGNLHENESTPTTSSVEPAPTQEGLRKRATQVAGVAMGAAAADPFADEMGMDFSEKSPELPPRQEESRESTATAEGERLTPLVIDTEAASAHASSAHADSAHGEETLIDLTPTTSAAPSNFQHTALDTPTSDDESSAEASEHVTPAPNQSSRFQSVHEWAETSTASFYSAPESETSASQHGSELRDDESMIDASDSVSHADVMSDVSDHINTPGSWTEVGSMISEEDA